MRSIFITIIILFLLTACGTAAQPATPTAMITPTTRQATETATATAKPTSTPEATATKEIKQFSFCTPETVFEHPLTKEDLRGPLHDWLLTQSKPFDPAKIRTDVPLIMYRENGQNTEITYSWDNAPNFTGKNEGKEPFRRYIVGYVEYTGPKGENYTGVIFATEFFDINNPTENAWVKTNVSFSGEYWTKENIIKFLKFWQDKMNVTVILSSDLSATTGEQDPLIAQTYEEYHDMEARYLKFVHNNDFQPGGDVKALAERNMILGGTIHKVDSGKSPFQ